MSVLKSSSTFSYWYNGINYIDVYNPDYYMLHNPDVKNAVLQHFVGYGMKEGRLAKASFNVYVYKAKYSNPVAAFGDDIESYYYHYINHGYTEERNCE